ncbi:MAG: hypothetical protein U0229_08390 [Anaeromyxobacter sp.]
MAEIDPRHLDKRVSHRYLRKGLLDEKEFTQHLKALEDLADRAIAVESTMENDDFDDEDDDLEDEDTAQS